MTSYNRGYTNGRSSSGMSRRYGRGGGGGYGMGGVSGVSMFELWPFVLYWCGTLFAHLYMICLVFFQC